jgi:hypothetical protein
MVELVLALGLLCSLAWVGAAATVMACVHLSSTPEKMIQWALRDTYVFTAGVVLLWALGWANPALMLMAIVRLIVLDLTDWDGMVRDFDSLKRTKR